MMLPPSLTADRDIVRRDPSLPGLGLLLDDEALLDCLQQRLPDAGIAALQVEYLRYKPASSCLARLRITRTDGTMLPAFARVLPQGSRDWGWQSRRMNKRHRLGVPLSAHAIDDALLLVARIEHDRRITALPSLLATQHTAEEEATLAAFAATLPAGSLQPLPLRLSPQLRTLGLLLGGSGNGLFGCLPLRYKPERRLVAQLLRDGEPVGLLRATTAQEHAGTAAGARLADALGGASLLAIDPRHHCVVSSWLPGAGLTPADASRTTLQELGALLHELHHARSAAMPSRLRNRQQDMAAVRQAVDAIGVLQPALADDARLLLRQLTHALSVASWQPRLTHGDMSLEHVIRAPDGRLQVIDWDNAALGDPMQDGGSLLARLAVDTLSMPAGQCLDIAGAMTALADGYGLDSQELKQLGWHVVGGMLRLMPEGFRTRQPDWPLRMKDIMQQAIGLSRQLAPSGPAVQPAAQQPAPSSAPADVLAQASDAALMQPQILAVLGRQPEDGARLLPVQVLRHKPGKRALLQYRLQAAEGGADEVLLGKLRFKGVDRHGFEVQKALFTRGFDLPALFVPEALAMLPEQRLWLQRKVPGTMASKLLVPDGNTMLPVRIGQAIASLHRTALPVEKRWSIDDELQMLQARLQEAAGLRPAWAERILAIGASCQQLAERLPPNPVTGIHRDCYADQILVDGPVMYWLDLDLYCQGDPALDVGNFVAHMIEDSLRHHHRDDALAGAQQALLRAYLDSTPHVDPVSITGWTTLSLARHIFISTRFAERQHTTLPLIELCERRLGTR